jgi:hypothetical protein
MKTLLLILLPLFAASQPLVSPYQSSLDTLPAILKIQQGNYTKYVKGRVVLKDCKVVEYLRVNTWRRKEQYRKFKTRPVDHRLIRIVR